MKWEPGAVFWGLFELSARIQQIDRTHTPSTLLTAQLVHSALNLLGHRQGRDLKAGKHCFVYAAGDEADPLKIWWQLLFREKKMPELPVK